MRVSFIAFAALIIAALPAAGRAAPITYTLQGTFSGSLGALSFTSVAGTFTFQGDDSGNTSLGAGYYTNSAGTSTLLLTGIGSAIFLSPTFGVESQFDGAGFYDVGNGFGVGIYDPTLGAYALGAPFSDTAYLQRSFPAAFGTTASTDLGELSLDGDDGTAATFTASQSAQLATTPEPSSLALVCTGLAGIASVINRRLRNAA